MKPNVEAELARIRRERNARETGSGGANKKPNGARSSAGALLLDPKDPMTAARRLREVHYDLNGLPLLQHYRGAFYGWRGSCYRAIGADALRTMVWQFLEQA